MPPRRRLNIASAAALPASRLPLGTPLVGSAKTSPVTVGSAQGSPTLQPPRIDSVLSAETEMPTNPFKDLTNLQTQNSPDVAPAKSIAEAKLERQHRRIAAAEASLTAPPSEKRAPNPRKSTKWKPFDFAAPEGSSSNPTADGGVPVTEVRINTFRPISREGTFSRPVSVISNRTSETAPSDIDHYDQKLADGGFQLYNSRKNKRNTGDVPAQDDHTQIRQATVEAAIDRRAIYEVFGNALPGPEFLEENVGFKNGQLQFLQHPNGDVSAHQWSSERYMWENIGQYSNIRKKVEGQLAADRLKGETAYQTLQQNTLAYFRLVAKQREANVMGLTFGAKEIQSAIPDPYLINSPAPKVAVPASKSSSNTPAKAEAPPSVLVEAPATSRTGDATRHASNAAVIMPSVHAPATQCAFRRTSANAPSFAPSIAQQPPVRHEDPFYTSAQHPTPQYGHSGYSAPYGYYGQQAPTLQHQAYMPYPSRAPGLNHDFHFPPLSSTNKPPALTKHAVPQQHTQSQQTYGPQVGRYGSLTPARRPTTSNYASVEPAYHISPQAAVEISAPQPQHAMARSAARDQLWKLTSAAKERSQSQANIRTVLHDPFQAEPTPNADERETEDQQSASPLTHHVAYNKLQPTASANTNPSRFLPTGLTPGVPRLPSPTGSAPSNNLLNSSPEPMPPKQFSLQPPTTAVQTYASSGTPQTFQPPFFPDESIRQTLSAVATSIAPHKLTYDEELHHWWTSGNRFARQEEFYQSLQRTQHSNPNKPQTQLGPIAPPSSITTTSTASSQPLDLTRLLIPVLENLSSYIQGPLSQRRDYFSQWSQPPGWAIDLSPDGNNSFFDKDWGTPPARVGRDPRYSGSRSWQQTPLRGRGVGNVGSAGGGAYGGSPAAMSTASGGVGVGLGLDRRFAFAGGGRY